MNCAFGLYPSSAVSRTNKIEELKIIDKRSQYTRPQTNHTYKCAIVCLCVFILVFWPPLRVVVCK
jgi:hypothetical protein